MADPALARVKEVFEQQGMYNAVVDGGYMHHRELAAALAAWTATHSAPLRVVDLGCGDAWLAAHAWHGSAVEHYLGVDMSEASIARAGERLADLWPGRFELIVGELAATLRGVPDASANVVLASYSIHHLSSDGKRALLTDCRRVLVPGGAFVWIDAVRRDDEARDAYITRLTHAVERDWTALTSDQRDKACAHIRESDFPETMSWMRDAAARAGFRLEEQFLTAEFFAALRFARLPNA